MLNFSPTTDRAPTTFRLLSTTGREACSLDTPFKARRFETQSREAAVARGPGDLLGEGLPLPEAGAAAAGRRRRAPGLAHPAAPGGSPRAEVPSGNRALSRLQIFTNFCNFLRARSRLYQNEFLQENMRSTAFFKLYKICILLHRCNLKIFAKKSV